MTKISTCEKTLKMLMMAQRWWIVFVRWLNNKQLEAVFPESLPYNNSPTLWEGSQSQIAGAAVTTPWCHKSSIYIVYYNSTIKLQLNSHDRVLLITIKFHFNFGEEKLHKNVISISILTRIVNNLTFFQGLHCFSNFCICTNKPKHF